MLNCGERIEPGEMFSIIPMVDVAGYTKRSSSKSRSSNYTTCITDVKHDPSKKYSINIIFSHDRKVRLRNHPASLKNSNSLILVIHSDPTNTFVEVSISSLFGIESLSYSTFDSNRRTFRQEGKLSFDKETWSSPLLDLKYISKRGAFSAILSSQKKTFSSTLVEITLVDMSSALRIGMMLYTGYNSYAMHGSMDRLLIDEAMCLRTAGADLVILILSNVDGDKIPPHSLHGYIDLLLVHDSISRRVQSNCTVGDHKSPTIDGMVVPSMVLYESDGRNRVSMVSFTREYKMTIRTSIMQIANDTISINVT